MGIVKTIRSISKFYDIIRIVNVNNAMWCKINVK